MSSSPTVNGGGTAGSKAAECSCPHFPPIKDTQSYASFKILLRRVVFPRSSRSRVKLAKRRLCLVCGDSPFQLHCCFFCTTFGCRSKGRNHLATHFKERKSHFLAVNVSSGAIFCFLCDDYVVDPAAVAESEAARQEMEYYLDIIGTDHWVPSKMELKCLKDNPQRIVLGPDRHYGLRGLLNLGHTCFMSSIIQSLVHTPCLTKYFLAEQHHCLPGSTQSKCLICELTYVFRQFYNGGKEPLSLNRLLYLVWRNKQLLAAYEQQDAHEFFIAILDLIHKRFEETKSAVSKTSMLNGIVTQSSLKLKKGILSSLLGSPPHCSVDQSRPLRPKCDCVVDAIFGGFLQSDLICPSCHDTSTTIDPFYDISLELPPEDFSDGITVEEMARRRSLENCLRNFTEPEKLGCLMECSSCHQRINGTKQLTLRTCPIVASFQFKVFLPNKEVLQKFPYSLVEENQFRVWNEYSERLMYSDTSTTIDPFYDISLELPPEDFSDGITVEEMARRRSLENCLRNFTEPEKLGCLMECSSCHQRINGTKQLTLRTCPIVASFQFKRSGYVSRNNRKTSTLVAFPEFLDLRPYTAQARCVSRKTSKPGEITQDSTAGPSSDTDYIYFLHAVVTHIGSGDGGHYICFVRSDGSWFRCDDHNIVETNRAEVLNSECYMLFYHKQTLDYYW
ncbi:unnamed protein product [Cyprideis torosa]|uniref:ubiquitinyl hydrolase 1 n=1 Tax=Cyprideis torosa TaxID=163714 RepID=A0A7R8ZMZ9_9CRUS|nr:unnamed protein product [Cyprideis torosa]CAG0886736.1 unnamed protein product [Cyprideis torosa]